MISTPSNPCPSPSLFLFLRSSHTHTVPVPYSALIDRERYTKLACIEAPKTSHSLKRNFLSRREHGERLGNVVLFPYDSSRYRFISFDRSSFFSPNEITRLKKKILAKRSKFFNFLEIYPESYNMHSYFYFFPKIYSRKTIPISEGGEVSLTNERVSFNDASIFPSLPPSVNIVFNEMKVGSHDGINLSYIYISLPSAKSRSQLSSKRYPRNRLDNSSSKTPPNFPMGGRRE